MPDISRVSQKNINPEKIMLTDCSIGEKEKSTSSSP
jgi:hypothetical protein